MKDYKELMNEAIRERLDSEPWNFAVASGVVRTIKIKKEKSLFRGYVVSLTAAAVFMLIFTFNIYSFIKGSSAVQNTSEMYSYSGSNDTLNTEDIDLLINEAFPMR